ncbi:MAG TPA: carboxypeptidase-like regulatory domain-containing protein [Albitalea sp.]|uniref:carboxypeptidase-like regulatory domain-containing protein n=1 Tax=Piscinibacter sp. TaxID=1903157 RepID=UPI002ED62C47
MSHHHPTLRGLRVAATLFAIALGSSIAIAQPSPSLFPGKVKAIGTLLVRVPGAKAGNGIEIPDAKISLLDAGGHLHGTASTQLDGRFRVAGAGPGLYQLCWDFQGHNGCRRVTLNEPENYLGRIELSLEAVQLHGRVLTGDQRPCWVNDPFFKLDVSTHVEVVNGGGAVVAKMRANVHGDYLALLKGLGRYAVLAQCEKVQQQVQVDVRTTVARTDLTLGNRAPRIVELAARNAGKGVVRVDAGAAVQIDAKVRDIDNDPVEFLWRDNDGQALNITTTNQVTRNAPATPGRHSTYLMARDHRGGYAFKRFDVEIGPAVVRFSGTVIDEVTRAPVAKARVEVAGRAATTDANGWFSLRGPAASDDRHVLNIRHPDYVLLSEVFDRSSDDHVFTLVRAQVTHHPVDAPIQAIDRESSGPCGNPRTPNEQVRRPPLTEYVDPERGKESRPLDPGLLRKLAATPRCQHVGAQIIVPAGALVAAGRSKPVGSIRLAMATLDPTRRPLAGDYQAVDAANQRTDLLSYGAVYADFRDAAGRPLNLRPGATAEVRVPVPPAQRSTAKPTIDFWSYDEADGRWRIEGKATLTSTPQGPVYLARTRHFSTLNMDVSGNDPAVSTCVRFEIDNAIKNVWTQLRLRATVSYNATQVKTKDIFLDGDQYHAVFRIPFGHAFPPNTLRVELFGTANGQSVVLVDNVINTDARAQMTGSNLWPAYPYSECGTPVVLAPPSGVVPEYATNDATKRPYFLTGPYGDFLPDDPDTVSTNYYNAIGATPNKPTLQSWWQANGFDPVNGTGGTRASYLNHNDLGFGRDMHCLKTGQKLACYVTNYGAPNQNAANADAAANQDPAQQGATVAMEFDPAAAGEAVQFYVYGNAVNSFNLLKAADLDGFGPKPVPHLCLVCHGGEFSTASNKAQQSRFREFDLPSFRYSGTRSWDYGQATLTPAELSAFGTLNQLVRDVAPGPAPIRALIDAWYPGNVFTGAPVSPAPPAGWASHASGYQNVYGKTCRTCHIARDGGAASPPFITFNSKSTFDGTSYVVCGKGNRRMPNAIITYKNFWLETARVWEFETLMDPVVTHDTCKND